MCQLLQPVPVFWWGLAGLVSVKQFASSALSVVYVRIQALRWPVPCHLAGCTQAVSWSALGPMAAMSLVVCTEVQRSL